MSLRTRRTVFQLTPLLDLLLIIIFAQYMDVRQAGAKQEEWFDKEAGQIKQEAVSIAEQEAERRQNVEMQLALAESQIESLQQAQNVNEQLLQDLKTQRQLLAEFINQALKVSPEMVDKMLSKSELAKDDQFLKAIEELRKQVSGEAIQHAVSYHELLKRCDIWEFFLDDAAGELASNVTFRANEDRHEWTINKINNLQRELKAYLRSRPQPKSLVIVLSGFIDEELTRGQRDDFRILLDEVFRELTLESGGQTRYYHRDLGYLGELNLSLKTQE